MIFINKRVLTYQNLDYNKPHKETILFMPTFINRLYKPLLTIALGSVLYCLFASFTPHGIKEQDFLKIETPKYYYPEYQFYKDAYNFRVANKLDIPVEYYDKLGITNPNPIVIPIQPPLTQAQLNRQLVPDWVLSGMLMRETRSFYDENGNIVYIDTRRGSAGERGPFQMKRICFDQISKSGEQYWKIEKNMAYAEEMAIRYLLYLYNGSARNSWKIAVGMYNTGPTNYKKYTRTANAYYTAVRKYGE